MQTGSLRAKSAAIAMVLIGMLLLSATGTLAAQDRRVTTVHAVGDSKIQGADMSASRNAAIADSLVAAINRVLVDIIPARMAVGHFQVLSETILSNIDPYILNYEMLTESISGNQHRVMVKVNISTEILKRRLKAAGIHLSQKQYPRLLYCIAEKSSESPDFQYWWGGQDIWTLGAAAEKLQKNLADKGYGIIQPDAAGTQVLPLDLSTADVVQLGRQAGADIVVVGRAQAEAASNTMGATLQSYRGTLSVQAIDVRSGQEVAQTQRAALATAENSSAGSQAALGNAAALAADDLSVQVARVWFSEEDTTSAVEVVVEGISGNVASFVKFRGVLSTLSGVDSVQRKEMQHDAAVLLVEYQGNIRALADSLMRQNFNTFGLDISEPEANLLRIKLVPR